MTWVKELVALGRGRVHEHAPLGPLTTYRVGGSARVLITLETRGDLEEFSPSLAQSPWPLEVIGNGSNLLVADGEHDVVAVRLVGEWSSLHSADQEGHVSVALGAGMDLPVAARRLAAAGIVGFEWAVGVPGTVGGAVAMNAGGHGADVAASLHEAHLWRRGEHVTVGASELGLGYRTSALAKGDLVLGATLRLDRGDPEESQARVREIVRWRREHQPGGPNAGSVFRNPVGDHAARLLDECGAKDLSVGGARVSEKHANFIQAGPPATAADVKELITVLHDRVRERFGVDLIVEHRFIGFNEGQ